MELRSTRVDEKSGRSNNNNDNDNDNDFDYDNIIHNSAINGRNIKVDSSMRTTEPPASLTARPAAL